MGDEVVAALCDELEVDVGDAVEEALAGTEDRGNDVEPQLVEQPGRQVLVDCGGTAGDRDSAIAGRLPRLGERGLDAVVDEGEGRPASISSGSRGRWARTKTGA